MHKKSRAVDKVRSDVERHFDFLFARGFATVYADHSEKHFGNWTVQIASSVCSVHLSNDRDFIGMEFLAAGEGDPLKRVTLEQILSEMDRGEEAIEPIRRSLFFDQAMQLARHARLLEKYLDVVIGYYMRNKP